MMKKQYAEPVVKVVLMATEDMVAASLGQGAVPTVDLDDAEQTTGTAADSRRQFGVWDEE